MSFFHLVNYGGIALSKTTAGLLIRHNVKWRFIYLIIAAILIICLGLWHFSFFPAPVVPDTEKKPERPLPLKHIFSSAFFLYVAAVGGYLSSVTAMHNWFVNYAVISFHMNIAKDSSVFYLFFIFSPLGIVFLARFIKRDVEFNIVFLLSHILKHLGRFGEAASTLHQIDCSDRNAIWLRAHFSLNILQLNELVQPCSEWGELLQELKQKMKQFKEMRKLINSDYFFYEAYYPIVAFYDSHFDRALIPRLLEIEENAIAYYEVEERRYLTNCYFIKAEFLRINKQWKDAEKYYALCYDICSSNGDKDIFYIVAISCTCLLWFEDVKLDIPFDWDKALAECKQQDGYGFQRRLISQMELSKAIEEFRNSWLSDYRDTITPIP